MIAADVVRARLDAASLRSASQPRNVKRHGLRPATRPAVTRASAEAPQSRDVGINTRRDVLVGLAGTAGSLALPGYSYADDLPKVPLGKPLPGSKACSAVIKGCWQLSGGHRGDRATDRTGGKEAVDDFKAFVDAGITTFDTGPEECGYGPSESIVGQFLRTGYGGAAVQVNSKLCFVGLEQRAGVAEFVRDRVDRSLSRFGRDSMGLMQLYWNDYSSPEYVSAALAMTDLKAKGRIGGAAFTNFNTETLERIYKSGAEVAANQIQYSLLDRRPELRMNDFCAATGMRLLPYGVVAGGFLSDAYIGKRADEVAFDTYSKRKYSSIIARSGGWEWFQELLRALKAVGDRHGQSVSNVATRWVLEKDSVGGVILGARNASHVEDHRKVFTFTLTPQDKAQIQEVLDRGKKSKGDCYDYERGGQW